ncbi:hypothetical protein C8F01DRAFT_103506 [Mycena amicta]|nr:hypothetical protein C8F01DRAFT_103506 [Mycena amicta]
MDRSKLHNVSHLLTSNSPPTDAQTQLLHELISAGQADTQRLDDEYAKAEATLKSLAEQRTKNTTHVVALRRVLSALRQFPSELIAHIFVLCVEQYRLAGGNFVSYHRRSPPMVLAWVCSRWRAIALDTPRIWDVLRLIAPLVPRKSPLACIDELVFRSAPHIFHAIITSRVPQSPKDYKKYTSPLLVQLLHAPGFFDRVGKLLLTLAAAHYAEAVNLEAPTFSALHTLRIAPRTSHSDQTVPIADILNLFKHVPALRALAVVIPKGPLAPRYTGPLPSFPWAQLEHLDWQCSLDVRVVNWILSQSTSLRTATFTSIRFNEEDTYPASLHVPPDGSTLPNLEQLTLQCFTIVRYPLLQHLTLPALRALNLRAIKSPKMQPFDLLSTLQDRSGFNLESLTIADYLETQYLPAFLHKNSGITTLHVRKHDGSLFRKLRVRHRDTDNQPAGNGDAETPEPAPVLLPALRSLTVTMQHDDDPLMQNDGEDLADMLHSRYFFPPDSTAPACAKLEKIDLHIGGYRFSDRAEEMVFLLRDAGCLTDHIEREETSESEEESEQEETEETESDEEE